MLLRDPYADKALRELFAWRPDLRSTYEAEGLHGVLRRLRGNLTAPLRHLQAEGRINDPSWRAAWKDAEKTLRMVDELLLVLDVYLRTIEVTEAAPALAPRPAAG